MFFGSSQFKRYTDLLEETLKEMNSADSKRISGLEEKVDNLTRENLNFRYRLRELESHLALEYPDVGED